MSIKLLLGFLVFIFCQALSMPEGFGGDLCQGDRLYLSRRYAEALIWYEDALKRSPKDSGLVYNLGNTNYKLNNYGAARKNWMKVVSMGYEHTLKASALYNIGNSLFREGRYREAADFYLKALRFDPHDKAAKVNLVKTLRRWHEGEGADQGEPKKGNLPDKQMRGSKNYTKLSSAHNLQNKHRLSNTEKRVDKDAQGGAVRNTGTATDADYNSKPMDSAGQMLSAKEIDYLFGRAREGRRKWMPPDYSDNLRKQGHISGKDW
jgi:tetratricopeptide (TPR) repeat protein